MDTNCRLLVVDDDEQKRALIFHVLRKRFPTATLLAGDNGVAAINELRAGPVTVVITDYKMEPVNGIELALWVRENRPGTPVIFMTSHPDVDGPAREAGAVQVVDFSRFAEIGEIVASILARLPTPVTS